jgi:hypothetical protein
MKNIPMIVSCLQYYTAAVIPYKASLTVCPKENYHFMMLLSVRIKTRKIMSVAHYTRTFRIPAERYFSATSHRKSTCRGPLEINKG